MSRIKYSIDGKDLKNEYGVHVSLSDGLIDRPKLKQARVQSWDNYHGQDVDLLQKYYAPRQIVLSCFIPANSKSQFISRVMAFERLFDKAGLHQLVVDAVPGKPLVYQVYCDEEIKINKKWSENTMTATLQIKLIEPYPLKRVLLHKYQEASTKQCSITLSSTKMLNVYWGDGSATEDAAGDDLTLTHNYDTPGQYHVVITGCIDEIKSFSSNASTIWNRL